MTEKEKNKKEKGDNKRYIAYSLLLYGILQMFICLKGDTKKG